MLHPAATRHPKATHQWLLMGVQACRLPSLKHLKPWQTLKTLKSLTTRHGGPSLPFAMLHPAANRHPKATHQWLLMGVQACRLPALKRLKPLKTLQTLKTLTTRHGGPSLPFARLARPHISGRPWKGVGGTRALAHSIREKLRKSNCCLKKYHVKWQNNSFGTLN